MPATCCENPRKLRSIYGDQDVQEILHRVQGNGESSYQVRWRDTVVLRKKLAIYEKMHTKQRVTAHFEMITLASQTR